MSEETINTVSIPTLDQLRNMAKEDLLKLKQDVSQLPTAIEVAIAEKLKEEAKEVETEVKTWAQKFREKNGVSVQVAVVGAVFIIFEVVPTILRLLGVH